MTQKTEVYRCLICGNIVEVLQEGQGTLVCCNQPMQKMPELINDAGNEKHVPVIEETPEGILVKVGSIEHPMDDDHYIAWIEVITTDGKQFIKHLQPHEAPQAVFPVKKATIAKVREYCTKHGLWKA